MENTQYTKEQLELIMEEIAPLQADFTDAIMRAADKIGVDRDGLYIHATNVLGIAARIGTYKDYEILSVADDKPVTSGKWEEHLYEDGEDSRMCCSACSNPAIYVYGHPRFTKFCPNCGARMDGDKK